VLSARVVRGRSTADGPVLTVAVRNVGPGAANDVRLAAFRGPRRPDRDPNRFPVPVIAALPPGQAVTVDVPPGHVTFTANGGRTRAAVAT
jgi:hypothetical protein